MDWVLNITIMKILLRALLVILLGTSSTSFTATAVGKDATGASPEVALQRLLRDASLAVLKEGNARFVAGKSQHPNLDADRRTATAINGQEPVATILTCSDSRAPSELIFDRGIGDLFIVRVAGNVAGESELATVEYGVEHLGTPVLLVMGHTKCGAVTAVVKGAELHGHLRSLVEHIQPAAEKAKQTPGSLEATVAAAIEANVWQTIENILTKSPAIRERAKAGKVHIIGAVYELETGRVNFLGSHSGQAELLSGGFTESIGRGPAVTAHEVEEPVSKPAPAKVIKTPPATTVSAYGERSATSELAPFPTRPTTEALERNQSGRVNSFNGSKKPVKLSSDH